MDMTLDLYVDYLICSTSYTTATGLSRVTDNAVSHDKVTRFLSEHTFTASDLWKQAKALYKSIQSDDGVIVIDDSIEEKPYTDENELIAWHFNHVKNRSVKGINFVTAFYDAPGGRLPVGYELVKKTVDYIDKKTGKKRRKSPISKQQMYRELLEKAVKNNVNFRHVLNDSWFSANENMRFVKKVLQKNFIMPLKSNRLVALSKNEQTAGNFVRIDSLELGGSALVWLQGLEFPLCFVRQVFKDEDGVTGTLYLVSSDLELTNDQIGAIYKRRWGVEVYHKSLKSNLSLAKSPTRTPTTQANHLFATLCAYLRLEGISLKTQINHFALKQKIYLTALKHAMQELQKFAAEPFLQTERVVRCAA